MALLPILGYPDPRLRETGAPVTKFDRELRTLIDDMFETMYDAPGIGLAATQVGMALQLAVMDCSEARDHKQVLINPELIETGAVEEMEEGCLSIPEVYATVKRYTHLTVRAQDGNGKHYELSANGLLAQCVQHEIDHLNGKLFVDYLSRLKRERIRKKLLKAQRHNAA